MSVINSRLRFASKSYSEWEEKNPILLKGELSWDSTNERFKIGNGESNWLDLEYCDKNLIDKLDELNIKLEIGTDWNQNNETAIDYVKNRTHWVEQGTEILLNSSDINYSENCVIYSLDELNGIKALSGEDYIITVDGKHYECTATENTYGEVGIGNSLLRYNGEYGDNSSVLAVPFYIFWVDETDYSQWDSPLIYSWYVNFDSYGVHSLKIEKAGSDNKIYHPLDEKFIPDTFATNDYVESLYKRLSSDNALRFYCIEDVAVIINGASTVYAANSNVEVKFAEGDVFEIIPTSNNSILALNAFPGALGTFYPWLEGVKQFSNILFDMNAEDMYSKWSQGNQGAYKVQFAQYLNCIFWSDNPYISDVSKRTNYTLYYTSQLPLCYSSIPDNTFKAFYLAFNVNSDPNWGNQAYRDSFAKATWATQVFSYYGARTIGVFGHDDPDFNITLPKDCRGLMCEATAIENAGTFDAINTTNFGAKSGSWRDAFRMCSSLRNLYIKNLKVNLNISWSPINYDSIYFIISKAANTNAITISVSPYTYNLLGSSDFELATSKNITIELLTGNYVEDRRLSAIDNKADKEHNHDNVYYTEVEVDTKLLEINTSISNIENGTTAIKKAEQASIADKATSADIALFAEKDAKGNIIDSTYATKESLEQKAPLVHEHNDLYYTELEIDTKLASQQEYADNAATEVKDELLNGAGEAYDTLKELGLLIDENKSAIDALEIISTSKADKVHTHDILEINDLINQLNSKAEKINVLTKSEQTLTEEELAQVCKNLKLVGRNLEGKTFTIDGTNYTASENTEIFGDYENNIAIGQWSIAEGSGTLAKGRASHVEGAYGKALQDGTHVEGYGCTASGFWSHAEGELTVVSSYASHAEGSYTKMPDGSTRYSTAAGYASHTEGGGCHTTGVASHAEGIGTTANGRCAHVEGTYTIASGKAQHVEGIANIEDTEDKYIHIAGNGTLPTDRSNAYTLDWDGNGWFAGEVYVGGTSKETGSKLISKAYADSVYMSNASLEGYYSKEEIDNMELITVADIDAICGATIMIADEETRF